MDQRDESFLKQCDIGSFLYKVTMGTGLEPTPKGAMVTGTVAHNVSLLAQYVSPVKKSESSRKVSDEYDYVHDLQGTSN